MKRKPRAKPPRRSKRKPRAKPKSLLPAVPRVPQPGKEREIDLPRVTELRRLGMKSAASIARVMGVPQRTMVNPAHAEDVREAMANGEALAQQDTLTELSDAIRQKNGNLTIMLIFKLKNICGWQSEPPVEAPIEVSEGVRDRVREACVKLQEKWRAEGKVQGGSDAAANA